MFEIQFTRIHHINLELPFGWQRASKEKGDLVFIE